MLLALWHLDNLCTRECDMGWDDIEDTCQARTALADVLELVYNEQTERYTPVDRSAVLT